MNISVIIPVYNSEQSLPLLVSRLKPVLEKCADEFELILVNDGSQDASWEVITKMVEQYNWIRGISLMRNSGQHNALLCGIRMAAYDVIVTIDDDLQHPPEEIHALIAKLQEGFDVVYGTPEKEKHGILRDIASIATKMTLKSAMGLDVARNVSAFRAFRTPLRVAFSNYNGAFVSIDVLLTWGATRYTSIPVQHDKRRIGASNYTFRKLIIHALNMITGFTTTPLQYASLLGFALTAFGGGVLVWVIAHYFIYGGAVPGFAFLASIVSIFSGAQLFTLGVIGEYIARMHFRLMDRPPYVKSDQVGWEPEEK
ncbi:MAG: glycosyltransferase family 2 protein [Flavobacteriales bacterium]|nr:glycosyltransferase family 2 protein [Flavobacteriales bacterium]